MMIKIRMYFSSKGKNVLRKLPITNYLVIDQMLTNIFSFNSVIVYHLNFTYLKESQETSIIYLRGKIIVSLKQMSQLLPLVSVI